MTDVVNALGVQSYCFRHFKDNAVVAQKVKDCGLAAIELCGVHVNFGDASTFGDIIGTYQAAGVEIVSIGVQGLGNNAAKERLFFDFCKQAGCKYMSVSFGADDMPGTIKTATDLADEYGIQLAIHNHGGRHLLGSAAMLRYVYSISSPRLGLCIDTAWALDSGENPVAMVKEFGSRLYGMHIKDFVFDRARKPEDVVVGTGNLDLKELKAAMDEVKFDGYVVLEYEGDVENPVPALQKCVQQVRTQMA